MALNTPLLHGYTTGLYKIMFIEKKYQPVKSIVDEPLLSIVSQYALLDELNNFSPEGKNGQVAESHSVYGDLLMESILLNIKPIIEQATSLDLLPTYSYYRVYRPGSILKSHLDRPACEISATVCFGQNYQDNDQYNWPMYVDGIPIITEPGDAIVYKGCEVEHWRDEFLAPPYSYHVQGFFHYVDANGPYKDQANDQRLFFGQRKYKKTYTKSYITSTK